MCSVVCICMCVRYVCLYTRVSAFRTGPTRAHPPHSGRPTLHSEISGLTLRPPLFPCQTDRISRTEQRITTRLGHIKRNKI